MSVPRPSVDRSIRRIDSEIVSVVVQSWALFDEEAPPSTWMLAFDRLGELVAARAELLKQLVPERRSGE